MEILNANNAVIYCLQQLKELSGYSWDNIKYINQGRYAVIEGKPNIAIIYKTNWFLKFGEMHTDKAGIGDSINCEELKEMASKNVMNIFIVHHEGAIYFIPFADFIVNSKKWQNKEGKWVRSISIHQYNRYNKGELKCVQ